MWGVRRSESDVSKMADGRCRVWDLGCSVWGLQVEIQGLVCMVQGARCRGLGFKVQVWGVRRSESDVSKMAGGSSWSALSFKSTCCQKMRVVQEKMLSINC